MSRILSALPHAGVVKCKKCGGTVACRAVDPPSEHSQPETAKPPPGYPVIVSCSCCGTALRYSPTEIFLGQPLPSATCVEHQNQRGARSRREKAECRDTHRRFLDCGRSIESRGNQVFAGSTFQDR